MDEVGKILEEMALFEGPLLERRQRLTAGRRAEVPPRLRHMDIKLFVLLIVTWLVCSESTLHWRRLRLARADCHPQLPALCWAATLHRLQLDGNMFGRRVGCM